MFFFHFHKNLLLKKKLHFCVIHFFFSNAEMVPAASNLNFFEFVIFWKEIWAKVFREFIFPFKIFKAIEKKKLNIISKTQTALGRNGKAKKGHCKLFKVMYNRNYTKVKYE